MMVDAVGRSGDFETICQRNAERHCDALPEKSDQQRERLISAPVGTHERGFMGTEDEETGSSKIMTRSQSERCQGET